MPGSDNSGGPPGGPDRPDRPDRKDPASLRPASRLVRSGQVRSHFNETSEAIYPTSGYVYESAEEAEAAFKGEHKRFIYSRYANPTVRMFEDRLAAYEGADICIGMASGMAAMFAALACQLKSGGRVVASRALFGSCLYVIETQLPAFGVEAVLVDGTDAAQWREALSAPADAVFIETPSNPALEIIDIAAVAALSHAAGARLIVDNAFATPVLQRPLDLGADIVMYSATKHIDGQGRALGGALLTNDREFHEDLLTPFIRHTGPSMSPFNAWIMLKGLETMELRVNAMSAGALHIARALESHAGVSQVFYPELKSHAGHDLAMRQMKNGGTMVSFEVAGGRGAAFRALNKLRLIDISNNLGDAKSLATHPATTTHQRLSAEDRARVGVTEGLIRLSVGLEDAQDLTADLTQALNG